MSFKNRWAAFIEKGVLTQASMRKRTELVGAGLPGGRRLRSRHKRAHDWRLARSRRRMAARSRAANRGGRGRTER